MRFSRARYVTLCQQSLVTAAVLAVGVSAAGVKTLDIVPQPGQAADLGAGVPGAQPRQALGQDTEPPAKTEVDVAPVTPKVREVEVKGISGEGAEGGTDPPVECPAGTPAGTAARRGRLHAGAGEAQAAGRPLRARAGAWLRNRRRHLEARHGICRRPDRRDGAHRGERHVVTLDRGGLPRRARSGRWLDGGERRARAARHRRPGGGRRRPRADACGDHRRQHPSRPEARRDRPGHRRDDQGGPGDRHREAGLASCCGRELGGRPAGALGSGHRFRRRLGRAGHGRAQRHEDRAAPQDLHAFAVGRQRAPARAGGARLRDGQGRLHPPHGQLEQLLLEARCRRCCAASTPTTRSPVAGATSATTSSSTGSAGSGKAATAVSTRAVVGAHTLGYNEYSFALSAIGNFDIKSPPTAVTSAYAKLFAWKLSLYNIRADNPRVYVKNRYFRAISGHRDAGQTACPGRYLYAKLPVDPYGGAEHPEQGADARRTPASRRPRPLRSPRRPRPRWRPRPSRNDDDVPAGRGT